MTVFQAGAIGGPLVAGVLIPVIGLEWLYLIDTVTLFATLVRRRPAAARWRSTAPRRPAPGVQAVVEGFAYLRHQPVLLMSFVVDLIAMIFGMPRALFPEIAHVDFGGPDDGRPGVRAALRRDPGRRGRRRRLQRLGVAGRGAGPCGHRLHPDLGRRDDRLRRRGRPRGPGPGPMLVVALLMLVVGGAADMASAAFRTSMLQSAADDAVRGRLQGVFIVVVAGGPRIADVVHGASAAAVGTAAAAAGGGVLVVVGTVIAVRSRRRRSFVPLPQSPRSA